MNRTVHVLALTLLLTGCSEIEFGTPDTNPLRDSSMTDPMALIDQKCVQCHDRARIDMARKTRDEWAQRLNRCQGYGAQINEVQKKEIGDYLYIRR